MARVSLRLFGTPRLDVDGEPAQLGRRKATALLAYLAVTRSRHHRESLATLLWPESGPEAAFSALRNVLWLLRQTPLSHLLRTDRSTVELDEDDSLWVDVLQFRDLTAGCPAGTHPPMQTCPECVSALEAAVALAEAPFMDGFMVSNADGFDDWQFAEREALQRELTESLDRLTAFYEETGNWAAATAQARRWLQVDRMSEICARRLMTGLAALGRRSESLRGYEEFRETLSAELGLDPEAATTELAERIRHTDDIPRARPQAPRRTNLPAALTPFVGREEVMDRVVDLLATGEARLLTLVGLGGIGKTSLALQVGRRLQTKLEDGVFFVALGEASDFDVVASAIAGALGLAYARDKGAQLGMALEDYLKAREILLVLDAADGIAPLGGDLVELLSRAPGARVLCTSRSPLGVAGESVVTLHGLDYPEEGAPIDAIGQFDAIRLLKVAERRVDSGSTDREPELQAMARVARQLDGFPLGLEMAGAWRGVFSWQEIADRIASNLDFLVHTHRDVPARHRNLRAVYEQAWSLLSQEERAVLCRLAVFRGGFTIEAAERTTDSSPAALAALAKRCLIRRVDPERYHVHELVRQFSLENLRGTHDDSEAAMERHATYFIELIEASFERLKGPDQLETLRQLQRDLPNVRAAWLYAAKSGRADLLRRAAHGLFFYFDMRAHFEEGVRAFDDAVRNFDGRIDPVAAGFVRVAYGWFTQFTAAAEPQEWISEGLRMLDDEGSFCADHALANVIARFAGSILEVEEARARLGRTLAFYRDAGDTWAEALTIDCLAGAVFSSSPEEGEELAEESLRLRKSIGDRWGEALNLATLANFAEHRGKLDLAKVRFHQSQRLAALIAEDLHMAITAQLSRARIAGRQGAFEEAEALAEQGLLMARGSSSRLLTARALVELGTLARWQEDLPRAMERLEESFSLLDGTPWRWAGAYCATLLAEVAEASGDDGEERRWRQEAQTLDPEGQIFRWME